ncbi:MAG: hypothetical protein JNK82_07650 [Myxococcaceae bacterium]|nr:hypothetical protein [Myxococcaceae bacterium]
MKLLALLVLSLSGEEAIVACEGKPVGAACVVTLSDGPHAGTCLGAPASCMPVPPPVPAS